jgi:hypothetical protein
MGIIGAVVLAGTLDLAFRIWRKVTTTPGTLAIVMGGLFGLYSVLGAVFGVLGLGPIGLFVVLSGLTLKAAPSPPVVGML